MPTVYKTKVAIWLICVIIGFTVIPIIPVLIYAFSWTIVVIVASILFFALYTIFDISYIINGNTLTVKCGFLSKTKYNINEISKIKKTKSFLSSPASSMDRIAIYFIQQRTPLIISPKNKVDFIKNLKAINPHIISTEFNQPKYI